MIKSLLSSFRKSIKTRIQLVLENIFLAKQLEIYQRNDPKLKIKRPGNPTFSFFKNIFSNWNKKKIKINQVPPIKEHKKVVKSSKRLKRK
jgi:hypothetical protein